MDWPGNSPDLNAIEPCWIQLKKCIISRGTPRDKKTGKEAWIKAWNELPQEQIQAWIKRLPVYIKEIICLEGGNKYKEGRNNKQSQKGKRIKGQLSKCQDLEDDGFEDIINEVIRGY